jgi:hypothetical protein
VAIGESRPGTVFTVDLTPGVYTFTVPNDLPDGSQPLSIELTAGAQVYFNVDANEWVDTGEQEHGRYIVNVREISAPLAARYFPALTKLPHNQAAAAPPERTQPARFPISGELSQSR